jgi:pimeloyl-ACP methyl ester carboxylesterase
MVMKKPRHIIYLPGLGDSKAQGQQLVVKLWRAYNVHGHCHCVLWGDGERFEPKLERLLTYIDSLHNRGYAVSLVGSSAGASAVLEAYAARRDKVSGVVIICGKVQHSETVGEIVFQVNPAFKDALDMLPKALESLTPADRSRIMSIHPLYDETVPIEDTQIEGARMQTILSAGHAISIGLMLTLGAPYIIRFLKGQARQKSQNMVL